MSICYPFCSLVAAPAAVAVCHLETPSAALDSGICSTLTSMGDHLLRQDAISAEAEGRPPSLVSLVPPYVKKLLGRAYSELYLLDDQALTLSYLNNRSPFCYQSQSKMNSAMLLLATPELVDMDMDNASAYNASLRVLADQNPHMFVHAQPNYFDLL